MFLAWLRYGQGPIGKYMLFLVLGERGGKIVGLVANNIPDEAIAAIKSRNRAIDQAPIEIILTWIRELWPGYAPAFREIYNSNCTIERKYEI